MVSGVLSTLSAGTTTYKVISYIVATIICLVFVAVAVVSCLKGNGIIM